MQHDEKIDLCFQSIRTSCGAEIVAGVDRLRSAMRAFVTVASVRSKVNGDVLLITLQSHSLTNDKELSVAKYIAIEFVLRVAILRLSTGRIPIMLWAAMRKKKHNLMKSRCVACGYEKDFLEVARVPRKNGHGYCRECLNRLLQLLMTDETLFPSRCCSVLPPVRPG